MSRVRLVNVGKRFGDVRAVADVNLEIEDREFLVLVGPSGCGKTTTLRMVAGLEDVSDGEIYIGDRLVNDVEPKDRDIAMVSRSGDRSPACRLNRSRYARGRWGTGATGCRCLPTIAR